ncbi:MAG: PrsW family intramembrane metalloprotease, partial [Pseudoclavibacter sp.]
MSSYIPPGQQLGQAQPARPQGAPPPTQGPGSGAPGPGFGAPQGLAPGPQFVDELPPKRNLVMTIMTIVIMAVAFLAILVILVIALLQSSVPYLALAIVLAIATLVFVWFVVWFIDRWEPQPKLLLFGALLWGAGIATAGALLVGLIQELIWAVTGLPELPEWWGAVVNAPIFEEFFKGVGVLVIYLVARKHFNGPTDGIVFGALSGAGFAFTENILYYSSQAAAGFEQNAAAGVVMLGFQVSVRGIAMPLLHPICVTLTGAAIGYAARRWGTGGAIGGFFVGLIPAIFVHFAWN